MYQAGEEYDLYTKIPRKQSYKKSSCKVIQECDRFVVVDMGNYRDTIEKFKLRNGETKLIKKGEIEMPKEPKITKEQLLKECHDNGIDKESLEEIAKKYNMSHITIKAYFHKWGIKEELSEKKNKGGKTTSKSPPEEFEAPAEETGTDIRYTLTEKGTAAVEAIGKSKQVLRPCLFAGKHFMYKLLVEDEIALVSPHGNSTVISADDVDGMIVELKELKGYLG